MLMKTILAVTVLCVLASCSYPNATGCTPFGVRLALGRNYYNPQEKQIVSVWFNTRKQCPKSFVTVEKDNVIRRVNCGTRLMTYSNYTSYIHKCSIEFLKKGDHYEYMANGWTGSAEDQYIPYANSNIKTHLVGPDQEVRMIVLADWSYLQQKSKVYDRLDNAFDGLLKSGQHFDLVFIDGDLAYDLSTAEGRNYENFLIMMSQISATWPCIFMTGNHQYYTPADFKLFDESFQLYNLTKKNATSLDLGAFTFVMFDPYNIIFENATKTHLLAEFKSYMEAADKKKPIIVTTHYPLACSGSSTHCKNQRFVIQQFFDMMVDYDTTFYIGAHYHTYERIYPYIKGGNFKLIPSPYALTKQTKYLVSVVEGIAGNDKSIVESYGKLSNFTAAVSYNQTGYGVMGVGPKMMTYDHFKATDWQRPIDSVVINYEKLLGTSQVNLRQQ